MADPYAAYWASIARRNLAYDTRHPPEGGWGYRPGSRPPSAYGTNQALQQLILEQMTGDPTGQPTGISPEPTPIPGADVGRPSVGGNISQRDWMPQIDITGGRTLPEAPLSGPTPDYSNYQVNTGGTAIRDFGGSTDISGGSVLPEAPLSGPIPDYSQPKASVGGTDIATFGGSTDITGGRGLDYVPQPGYNYYGPYVYDSDWNYLYTQSHQPGQGTDLVSSSTDLVPQSSNIVYPTPTDIPQTQPTDLISQSTDIAPGQPTDLVSQSSPIPAALPYTPPTGSDLWTEYGTYYGGGWPGYDILAGGQISAPHEGTLTPGFTRGAGALTPDQWSWFQYPAGMRKPNYQDYLSSFPANVPRGATFGGTAGRLSVAGR